MLESLPNLHPFVVHFPIALFLSALAGDVFLLAYARSAWLDRALTLAYGGAALGSLAAALSGKLAAPESGPPATLQAVGAHGDWAFLSVVLLFLVLFLRLDVCWRDRDETAPRLHRARGVAFVLAVAAAVALIRTAEHGGRLVFRHGVGVTMEDEARER